MDSNSDKRIIGIKLDSAFDVYKASYLTTSANDHVLKDFSLSNDNMVRVSTGNCKDSSNIAFQGVMIQEIVSGAVTSAISLGEVLCFLPESNDASENFEPFKVLNFAGENVALLLKETTSSKKLMVSIIHIDTGLVARTYEYGVSTETIEPLAFNRRSLNSNDGLDIVFKVIGPTSTQIGLALGFDVTTGASTTLVTL